ncbi:peptide ABC transporter permease protein [Candidatus Photodesmus blepharus]|uniref:Peptide ABC transporter permease protein n=1 Tax=Candidatus Photodesmus blepharonis TaxID=1179155 RepID=A0A084CN41_9GAMM|nr:ABC transporter permease subunit [Candidatus Photodesmus blepharus]KEY91220.1 peptide ABC transporter permease protein [Candidatus Photodesmus blepharus]
MLTNNIYQEEHIPTQFERFWNNFCDNGCGIFGLWCLLLLILITLTSPWLTPYQPEAQTGESLIPPSWHSLGNSEHFMGTDNLGRDILSRLIVGSQLTFGAAIVITLIAAIIGCSIGILAGMTKGLLSSTLNHLLDTVMSIPSLPLAIIFVTFLNSNTCNIFFAICLALIPRFARSVYIAMYDEMGKDYVLAARLDGINKFYLLWHSILPNIFIVLATEITYALSVAILDIAALGFLGLLGDTKTPTLEWGSILGDYAEFIYIAPWTVILPGLPIILSVIAVNLTGEGIRETLSAGVE